MVHFVASTKKDPDWWIEFTGAQYQKLCESPLVESMAAFQGERLTTTGGELPEDLHATFFTGNVFNFFGLPLVGRGLQPGDAPEGADTARSYGSAGSRWRNGMRASCASRVEHRSDAGAAL